ncbi:MAG TPA: DUF6677 family protein [Pyrinomonadaceae bacterium]|nr:DUF6677 family protein [Pyrinomonadaceae bacterium]
MSRENQNQSDRESAPGKAWLAGTVGWFFPGAGHLLHGNWSRALVLGGVVWISFISGLLMGGRFFIYTGTEEGWSGLLQIPPMIANLGSGLLYLVCWVLGVGFADDPELAARSTFEYGTTFLLIAGLLNYLCMLDAFDIAAGRKS